MNKMGGLGISLEDMNLDNVKANLHLLDEREKHIILHLTGIDGHPVKSLNSIADDLKISRERTRQIAIMAVGKLDAASAKDKEEVIESFLYLIDNVYGGELPKSFDIKCNHNKLYWKIRGTFGDFSSLIEEVKKRRALL